MTHLPPATTASALRERFVAEMTVRGFTEKPGTTTSAP